MSLGPLYVLLGEVSVQVLCPFFNWIVCLLALSHVSSLYILEIKSLSEVYLAIIFPYGWFSFHFVDIFFSHAEAFKFDVIPFVYSSLISLALGDVLVKILLLGISEIFLPMLSSRT